ncbi:2-amino-4-deoxychorismate dehydrogenase [Thermoflexales bacterium]|nr:2-amino-4-deoxychorismate dehydrogenase [Thermoflexales bacterium]
MKIVALNGSQRGDKGYTHFLIERLFQGARAAGAECEEISLARHKLNRCLACRECQGEIHYLNCLYTDKDDVSAIFQKMRAADLIIYATPVYVFGMSSLLKMLLERFYGTGDSSILRVADSGLMFHHIDPALCSKPFVLLVCCDNLEPETPGNVISYFRTFARFMDAPQVGTLMRNAGLLSGYGQTSESLRRFPKLAEAYAAFVQAGRELATTGHVRSATQRRANQDIVLVPLFGWLKRLPLKSLKRKFVVEAQKMLSALSQ